MAKLRIKPKFRILLSEKLLDLGNLAVAALVFGQFLSGNEFSVKALIIGFLLLVACVIMSFVISS